VTTPDAAVRAAEQVARYRPVEKLKPGYWWLGDYDDGRIWGRVDLVMETERISDGRRLVRVAGTDPYETDEELRNLRLVQVRGASVLSITEVQARKCGLDVEDDEHTAPNGGAS
jgi:hypothetical protein